jgi:threonylcarbamoyladenosine tRNA methylthiotransferase MtaB
MAKLDVITMGCRLNSYESEVMRRHAEDAGLDNVVIINTCAVTNEAVRQASQTIRKIRRQRPGARVVVTGCAAQIKPEMFADMAEVDHVVGNDDKMHAATFQGLAAGGADRVIVNDIMSVRETASHALDGFGSRARAFVQVQNGCDHRCTFCIIPYGRGPSRSVPAGDVVQEIQSLVDAGYREVVLTGVDMTSYGGDLPGKMSLGLLTKHILRHVPDLERLRLSSIDQVEADQHLLDVIANEDRLMPHLHLSMQAGDNMILKRMKRRHSREDAIAFCNAVRALRPDVVFGADLIAGFPTESEEMFANTERLVEECGLTYLHVFPFSPRDGTPAARMPQLDRQTVKARAERLRRQGQRQMHTFLEAQTSKEPLVLIERAKIGRTPQFAEVKIESDAAIGTVTKVRIRSHDGQRLIGDIAA